MTGANFSLADVNKVLLEDCLISGLVLENSRISGLSIKHPIGAESLVGIPRTLSPEDDRLESPELHIIDSLMGWDKLRFVRTLKLFAVSYTAMIFTPLILICIVIWNDAVLLGRTAIDQANSTEPYYKAFKHFIDGVPVLSAPENTTLFFAGSCMLAAASTLFVLACPARVREFSAQKWLDEVRGSPISYFPYTWSRALARVLVWALLLAGGALAGWVILSKIGKAVAFVWSHGGASS